MRLDLVELEQLLTDALHAPESERAEIADRVLEILHYADAVPMLRRVRELLQDVPGAEAEVKWLG